MLIPVSTFKDAEALRSLPVVAVDLGFSGSIKSCAVATRDPKLRTCTAEKMRFAECVDFVVSRLSSFKRCVLIVEAPLSAAFDHLGNPAPRGSFESRPKPRWWSIGAGAAMALAAQYLLRECCVTVPPSSRQYLIEGFVTGADSGDHAVVAKRLLETFLSGGNTKWVEPAGANRVSIMEWLGAQRPQLIPVVLVPGRK